MTQEFIERQHFQEVLPSLTEAEYSQLKKNIEKDGKITNPIVLREHDHAVIDGYHRIKIAKELGLDVPVSTIDIGDKEERAHLWILKHARGQRNLDGVELENIIGMEYQLEKSTRRERNEQNLKKGDKEPIGPTSENEMSGDADEPTAGNNADVEVAQRHNVARNRVHSASNALIAQKFMLPEDVEAYKLKNIAKKNLEQIGMLLKQENKKFTRGQEHIKMMLQKSMSFPKIAKHANWARRLPEKYDLFLDDVVTEQELENTLTTTSFNPGAKPLSQGVSVKTFVAKRYASRSEEFRKEVTKAIEDYIKLM